MNAFRFTFLFLLFFTGKNSIAQTLKTYKNAQDHFEIGIPDNWEVTQSNPRLKLIAIRPIEDNYDAVPENINLNFIDAPDGNLDAAYNMSMESNSNLEGFISITNKGTAENGRYKWYVNTHQSAPANMMMQTVVFVFYARKTAVLLTCTASKDTFETYSPLFFRIANSLKLQ